MSDSVPGTPVSDKVCQLNLLVHGGGGVGRRQGAAGEGKSLLTRDGLLDSLLALYAECSHDNLMRNQYVKDFVWKHKNTVEHLKRLRVGIRDFEVKNVIGRGHFGEVQVVREKSTSDVYALKVLRKADTLAQQSIAFYEEERDIMAKASSPWLTQLQYAFQDNTRLYLVMEFHPGGDLLSLLGRYDDTFEESMARFYLAEMVLALHALHGMGYIHRDVKPENVLIDRTGHVKLVDFGSACKLHDKTASVSNMPVGTPDYICPEVLVRMNDTKTPTMFGCECDWWSVGVCAFEMLFGKTPFTSDDGSMVTTYANIMNFKDTLRFPGNGGPSAPAEDFIRRLLTDSERRLQYDQICVHPFFSKLDFSNMRQSRPPFIPTVTSEDDTSNFEEFEKSKPTPSLQGSVGSGGFTGRDLPFIGFTFTKQFSGERLPSVSEQVSSPACKNSLERRLASKSQELQDLRAKCKALEDREAVIKADLTRREGSLLQKEQSVHSLEMERDAAEKNLAHYITEVNSLKRLLELEKQQRASEENKTSQMFAEVQRLADRRIQLHAQDHQLRIKELERSVCELTSEGGQLSSRCDRLKSQLKQEVMMRKKAESARDRAVAEIKKLKEQACSSEGDVRQTERKLEETERQWQAKLSKMLSEQEEVMETLQTLRESKNALERQVLTLQMERDSESHVRKRLFESEIKCRNLESEASKLAFMEKKEEQLRGHLEEKSAQLRETGETLQALEERLENREIEYKKCERIYRQRESQQQDKIQDLEGELHSLRALKCELEESSVLVCEENEDKIRQIHEQEQTIAHLREHMDLLEQQVGGLREEMERTPTKHRHGRSRRACLCETESPLRSPLTKKPRQVEGGAQTDSHYRQSGSCQTDLYETDVGATQTSFRRSRSRSASPHTEGSHRSSGCCQTDPPEVDDFAAQTSFVSERRTPKKVSFLREDRLRSAEVQTTPEVKGQRRSNLTQTSPMKPLRKSNQVQTDLMLPSDQHVSVSQGQGSITVEVKVRAKQTGGAERGQGDLPTDDSLTTEEGSVNSSVSSVSSTESEKPPTEKEKREKKVKVNSRTWWPRNESDTREKTEDQGEKETRRRQEEQLSDLRQEKVYLEYKVGSLEAELREVKDGGHMQRVRALDLKQDLREATEKFHERTSHYEHKVDELKDEVTALKVKVSEASIHAKSSAEKEEAMRGRLERAQAELDRLRIESRGECTGLREAKESFESQVKFLSSKCEKLEENNSLLSKCVEETEEDLKILTQKYIEVVPRNRELETDLKKHQEEKTRLKLEVDRLRGELTEKCRKWEQTDQQNQKLQSLCRELESQLSDFETLNSNHEQKESNWSTDRLQLEKSVEEQGAELSKLRRECERDRETRQKLESKRDELTRLLETSKEYYECELSRLRGVCGEQDTRVDILNHQLTQMEKERSMVEVDSKKGQRRAGYLEEENGRLKEEISSVITKLSEVKNSNLKLNKNLEDAMDRYEMLANQNADLTNKMDALISAHSQERFKMEATLSQQSKLIDYLQAKVENPPRKRKGLFTPKSDSQLTPGIQLREMQHSLDHERDKNTALKQEIVRLKDELHQARAEGTCVKRNSRVRSIFSDSGESLLEDTPTSHQGTPYHNNCAATLTAMTLTATPRSSAATAPHTPALSVPKTPKSSRKQDNRKLAGVAHRFFTGLNTKATKCGLCLGAVHFVKLASKCEVCRIVCHPKCVPLMPPSCGAPIEYVRLFAETLQLAKTTPTMRLPITRLNIHLSTWIKVPRSGKHAWEKRYMILKENRVQIHARETSEGAPLQEIDLCPQNAEVTVHSGVTAAELNNTATSDLPYIMRLEIDPRGSSGAGSSHYLMFLNFTDKQKWAAVLEAIVNHSDKNASHTSQKILGNLILSLSNRRLEVNCTLLLSDNELLVGTDEGLFLLELEQTSDGRGFLHIEGVDGVSVLDSVPELDVILMLTGRERRLHLVYISSLQTNLRQNPPTVTPTRVEDVVTATVFAWRRRSDGLYLCVATAEDTSVTVMKYCTQNRSFSTLKVVEMSEACACLHFGEKGIVLGADKFYSMDPSTYTLRDFLDDSDSSLAFAAFGASQYESFPIAVVMVSSPGETEEYLLCFNLFGVFVDSRGRRTRQGNLKWRGLPLNFAYRQPYLFIVQYNVIQVTEILPRHTHRLHGDQAVLNVPCPRYLGPAPVSGAVYIAAIQEGATEILCYRGNMASHSDSDRENYGPEYATPRRGKKSRRVRDPDTLSTGSESPVRVSPTAITDLSTSPRRRQPSETSISSESSAHSVDSLRHAFEKPRPPHKQQTHLRQHIPGGSTSSDGSHATIRTLKEVLAEQSRQRRGMCRDTTNLK